MSAEEPTPDHTGSRATRVLGVLTLLGLGALLLFGLVLSPADVVQQDSVRLMYVHVPSVSLAYVAVITLGVASAMWLWKRTEFWDLLAASAAEVAVVFCALGLATGMIWGRPTWGVYWVWDARLTTTVLLFVMLIGYLALRRLPSDETVRARRSALLGLLTVVNIPIIHYSVDWWRTLHQGPTLSRLDPQIDGLMLFSLMLGLAVGLLGFTWLMIHRFRLAHLEGRVARIELDDDLRRRRDEGRDTPDGVDDEDGGDHNGDDADEED